MTIINGYATAAELKTRLGITDTSSDTVIEAVIEATSRAIDAAVCRRIYAASETRYYTTHDDSYVWVDDLVSVTTLKTDHDGDRVYEYTWSTTDYDLLPVNASVIGWPHNQIAVAPGGLRVFPVGASNPKAIQVVGSFGFASTTPDEVNEACLIAGAQIFLRKDSPYGVTGGSGFVQMIKNAIESDPHVWALIRKFKPYV
jgi:hypothetical protein